MSAEAIRNVIEHSTARGAGLIALIMLADESDTRTGHYPIGSISMPAWAKKCRCSERSLFTTVQKLIKKGQLFEVLAPHGQRSTVYEIPLQGRKVSKGLERKVSATLIREDPLEHISRADQLAVHDPTPVVPPNVIQYPKPQRKRQSKA